MVSLFLHFLSIKGSENRTHLYSSLHAGKRKRRPDVADFCLSFKPSTSLLIVNYCNWCSKGGKELTFTEWPSWAPGCELI